MCSKPTTSIHQFLCELRGVSQFLYQNCRRKCLCPFVTRRNSLITPADGHNNQAVTGNGVVFSRVHKAMVITQVMQIAGISNEPAPGVTISGILMHSPRNYISMILF